MSTKLTTTIEQAKEQLQKQGWTVSIVDSWVQARNHVVSNYYRAARYMAGGVLWCGMHGGFHAVLVREEPWPCE